MATEVIMPALNPGQETGILLEWLKQEGETIEKGEPLMEVETDKANVEVEAEATGILSNISVQPGDEIHVGEVIAMILSEDESAPKSIKDDSSTQTAVTENEVKHHSGNSEKMESIETGSKNKIAASPKVKQYAKKEGLDLSSVKGSGPGGAILMEDVLAIQSTAEKEDTDFQTGKGWLLMADRLTESWTSAPHFSIVRNLDATNMAAHKKETKANSSANITFTDLLVKYAASSLKEHPRVNASLIDGKLIKNLAINIGIAVATEDGLIVPVIHNADELSLEEITERRKELVARTQEGKLRSGDLDAGTFTISNLGMFDVDSFNAIINPPQSAILAVGRIIDQVVPMDGKPVIRPMLTINLSFDHRVIDGARGAHFLKTISNFIEDPN
ncbi:MAG: dihydrolipoamide acetyltransferase family protein [SAR324 cluster bacterium]|nr:dihydrolipoamide acetyltransferase family protein [SAR324 cluster bacterium]